MPEAQAEVLAQEQARLVDSRSTDRQDIGQLSTFAKETTDNFRSLRVEIDEVKERINGLPTRAELKAEVSEAKAEILKWMFGTIGFQTLALLGAIVAVAKAIH